MTTLSAPQVNIKFFYVRPEVISHKNLDFKLDASVENMIEELPVTNTVLDRFLECEDDFYRQIIKYTVNTGDILEDENLDTNTLHATRFLAQFGHV